jgi:hypothetical protein
MMLGCQKLRLGCVEKFQIGFSDIPRALLVNNLIDDSHGRLAQNAARRIDDVEFILAKFLPCEPKLIFPV